MKPSLDRQGTLRFPDGPTFLAPKVTALELSNAPTLPLELSGLVDSEEWESFKAKIDHSCKSGPCKHAHRPKCKCGCKGIGHRIAILQEYHSIQEYNGEDNNASPSTPLLMRLYI